MVALSSPSWSQAKKFLGTGTNPVSTNLWRPTTTLNTVLTNKSRAGSSKKSVNWMSNALSNPTYRKASFCKAPGSGTGLRLISRDTSSRSWGLGKLTKTESNCRTNKMGKSFLTVVICCVRISAKRKFTGTPTVTSPFTFELDSTKAAKKDHRKVILDVEITVPPNRVTNIKLRENDSIMTEVTLFAQKYGLNNQTF